MSYSVDYRKRTIEYRQEGHTLEETSETFRVAISTIRKWEKQLREQGNLTTKVPERKHRKIPPDQLREYVAKHPDAYQAEIAKHFGCSKSGIQKALAQQKITRKKKTTIYEEQNQQKVTDYKKETANISPEIIAYVDETGIDCYLYREYGYAPRGQLVRAKIKGRKYARTGIVAAKMGDEIIAPCRYSGTMNHELFEDWFENYLIPELPDKSVIVMDNATFHRKKQLNALAQKYGHTLIFLPPYSPELNPIEKFWAWLKATLRKILPHLDCFDDALFAAFYFRHQLIRS